MMVSPEPYTWELFPDQGQAVQSKGLILLCAVTTFMKLGLCGDGDGELHADKNLTRNLITGRSQEPPLPGSSLSSAHLRSRGASLEFPVGRREVKGSSPLSVSLSPHPSLPSPAAPTPPEGGRRAFALRGVGVAPAWHPATPLPLCATSHLSRVSLLSHICKMGFFTSQTLKGHFQRIPWRRSGRQSVHGRRMRYKV